MSDETTTRIKRASLKAENSISVVSIFNEDGAPSGETLSFDHAKIPVAIGEQLLVIGLRQIVSNTAAKGETVIERLAALTKLQTSLYDGSWEPGRVEGEPVYSDTVLALHAVVSEAAAKKGLAAPTVATVAANYEKLSKVEKMKRSKDPRVTIARAKIVAARNALRVTAAKAALRVDDTLDSLDSFAEAAE
jgi:hypothetical protein